MAKVKLDFKRLSIADKIVRSRQISKNLDNNPDFPTPNPPLTQLKATIDALEAKVVETQAARQTARALTSEQNELEDTLDNEVAQVVGYVDSASGGDETKIIGAGFSVRAAPGPAAHETTAPSDFSLTHGDHDGELGGHWNRVNNARSYVLQRSLDPPTATSWVHEKIVTTSSTTITGLTSGVRYWFRVASIGSGGQSGWSEPATKIAP